MVGSRPSPEELKLLDPEGTFPARLAADRAVLVELAGDLAGDWAVPGGNAGAERLRDIATLAHRLAGAAGTFGFQAVGDAALALELRIVERDARAGDTQWTSDVRLGIRALLSALDGGLVREGFLKKSGSGQVQFRK